MTPCNATSQSQGPGWVWQTAGDAPGWGTDGWGQGSVHLRSTPLDKGRRVTWACTRGDKKNIQEPQGECPGLQFMDLKEQANKEENRMLSQGPNKSFMSFWRTAPQDTHPLDLPFIYCIFNSEHLRLSLGGPRGLASEGREWGRAEVGILGAGDRHGSSLTQSPITTSFSATSTRPGT